MRNHKIQVVPLTVFSFLWVIVVAVVDAAATADAAAATAVAAIDVVLLFLQLPTITTTNKTGTILPILRHYNHIKKILNERNKKKERNMSYLQPTMMLGR